MNPEYMQRMSAQELEAYAKQMGFTTKAAKSAEDKIKLIENKRNRTADITVLGIDISVPIKAMKDKRVADILTGGHATEEDLDRAVVYMLGQKQRDELYKAATEPDGLVDATAIAYALNTIINSPALKNF